jgi:hypothetical protein
MAFALAWTLGCGEISTTRASNAAEAARVLEPGGWWPSGISEAATAIRETHDLDTNAQKIIFSLERDSCRQAAAPMDTPAITALTPVPALPLEGWPAWLSAEVDRGSLPRRGAALIRTQSGALVLVCDDEKGYYWR